MQCTNPFHLNKGTESSLYFSLNFSYITDLDGFIFVCKHCLLYIVLFLIYIVFFVRLMQRTFYATLLKAKERLKEMFVF